MNCSFEPCRRPLSRADEKRRVELRKRGDLTLTFGPGMPDGNIDEAAGTLVQVLHHKCYFASQRRQQLLAARAADPSSEPGDATDWREPETVELEEVIGEGDRGNRGAGAPRH